MKLTLKNSRLTEWFIALRYLFSKKSHSIINIISFVTLTAIAVPTAAMIIIMSVYNGLEDVLKSLYSNFDTEITITPRLGKTFDINEFPLNELSEIEGVDLFSEILEDNAMVEYRGRQTIATVRGVDDVYKEITTLDSLIVVGNGDLRLGDFDYAVLGMGVAYDLGINVALYEPLSFYVPKTGNSGFLGMSFYNKETAQPNGIFSLDEETDTKYIISGLRFTEKLFSSEGKRSQIGIQLKTGANEEKVISQIKELLGEKFVVKNRYQQKEILYNVMNAEKQGVFLIIVMILIVASFTLVGSVIMLITDKQGANFALKAMGATDKFIKNIFIYQGLLITLGGLIVGVVLGVGMVLIQEHFGLITIDSQTILIDSYPVKLNAPDVISIILVVTGINSFIAYITTKLTMQNS
ncbi:MAG: FtsX-like permease family protein [Rikenellaceae bacterium]